MADPIYIAKTNVTIGRKSFRQGEKISGVSVARCEQLRGRFVETEADAKASTSKSAKPEK